MEHHDTQFQYLKSLLWPATGKDIKPAKVFAVIDCARDKRLEPLINNSDLNHRCLYEGNLNYALKRAAPHLIELEASHPFTATLLNEGWGQSWGIFFVCPNNTDINLLRNNCRRISKVRIPNGKTFLFRYYDPRVLRLLLPTVNTQQCLALFGPATKIIMEMQSKTTALHAEKTQNKLKIKYFTLAKELEHA